MTTLSRDYEAALTKARLEGYDDGIADAVKYLREYADDLRGDRRFDDFKARDARAVKNAADGVASEFGQIHPPEEA